MDAKVREVAKGFEYEAKSFKAYDMNAIASTLINTRVRGPTEGQ